MNHDRALRDPPGEVEVLRDLPYARIGERKLLADLYLPRAASTSRAAILWLHGGGWRFGDRRLAPDLIRHYAQRGYVMASIDYRLSKQAVFPAALEDVKTAIRWLKSIATQHAIDPHRIGLWGSSAGGHLGALAATSGDDIHRGADYPDYSSSVAAVVDCYGPTDFSQLDAHRDPEGKPSDDAESIQLPPGKFSADADSLESLFLGAPIGSCADKVRAANPITYIKNNLPPFLILHGLSDTAVPAHQSELLYQALARSGNRATLALIEGLGHGFTHRKGLDDSSYAMQVRCTDRPDGEARNSSRVFAFIGGWLDLNLAR